MHAKKIVLFSDGTGNSSAKAQKTNVWRLFQALDQTRPEQIAKYDDGVGTSSNKYLAAIGGAFGWGLKRNVLDLYRFVCLNHRADDQIYGFGFSRGAFTIRVLVDLITTEGLVAFRSEEELNRNSAAAYRHYRSVKFPSWSPFVLGMRRLRDALVWIKDRIKGYSKYSDVVKRKGIPIRLLGLWDTVEAYGMPIGELKRGIDWVLWPMLFGDHILPKEVQRACHALSLNDERLTFHPLLWDEQDEAEKVEKGLRPSGRITQAWFAGVHSNVGGGYPEDQLSLVSLEWMIGEAIAGGLHLDPGEVDRVRAAKSPYGRLYDSRAGFASYYRYAPRCIPEHKDAKGNPILPVIHGSVVMRMACGADRYVPISLPHRFRVLAPDGQLLSMEATPRSSDVAHTKDVDPGVLYTTQPTAMIAMEKQRVVDAMGLLAAPDAAAVEMVWDTVFWRRLLYWVTMASTALLLGFPLFGGALSDGALAALNRIPLIGGNLYARWEANRALFNSGARGPISAVVDLVKNFLPSYAAPWTEAFELHPLEFAVIAAVIVLSLVGSRVLDARIHDRAWLAWHRDFRGDYHGWTSEAQKGWRNGVLCMLVIFFGCLLLAILLDWSILLQQELMIVVVVMAVLLMVRSLAIRPVRASKSGAIQKTFAMTVAGFLRNNGFLRWVSTWVFERVVPIVFALVLLGVGLAVANRVVFDVAGASGYFCKGSAPLPMEEKIGRSTGFLTSHMCWPSGLVLKEGRRYRITLTTPGDWVDKTFPADVAGFPTSTWAHRGGILLRRWWFENWFKPIVRIGRFGNDEYVLTPSEDLEKGRHPRAVVTDIKARTTGELFVYVNDAVLMWPGFTSYFYHNNKGSGEINVERLTGP